MIESVDGLFTFLAQVRRLSFGFAQIGLGPIYAGADSCDVRRHLALPDETFCFCDEFDLGFDGRDDLV